MAVLQAYFDESGKHADHPVVTFTGVCAPLSKLQHFNDAWESLLQQFGLPALHMKEAARPGKRLSSKLPAQTLDERVVVLKQFADCMNNNLEMGIIQAWDVKAFEQLSKHARGKLGSTDDPYFIAFIRGMLHLADYVQGEDKISLICDDDEGTAFDCYRHYRAVRRVHPEVRNKVVSLSFANDRYFPALQAADMVAFLARLEAKNRFYGIPYSFWQLLKYVTDDQSSGRMQWFSAFADRTVQQKIANDFDKMDAAKRR